MKKVVISGYYGYDNVGDEALLKAIVDALRSCDNKIHITVLSAQPEKTGRSLGVAAVSRTNLRDIVAAIRNTDLLISGGGSLLQDVTGPLTIPYYLGIVAMAKALGKPVMFYAQGVGPVNKKLGRTLIKHIVNKVDLITLRDRESAELLKEIGVRKPVVKVTADPVFGLGGAGEAEPGERVLAGFGIDLKNGPLVGIAIRPWPNYESSLNALAEAAGYLLSLGRQVVIIPMHYPVDLSAAKELHKRLGNKSVLLDRSLGPDRLMALTGKLELVIAMRLHALIFGAVQGVPVIGISYDPKVDKFLQSPGCFSAGSVDSVSSETLIRLIDYILRNREAVSGQLAEFSRGLREAALENARLAIELLHRKAN